MDNLKGSLLMVAAMAAFAVEDVMLKSASAVLPVGEILILFGLGGMMIFAAQAKARGQAVFVPAMVSKVMVIRSGCELVGRTCYMLAIALTPLSTASAILQATPLVVAAGAVVFFAEKVGPWRWAAIGVGFVGVLMILRPGMDGFAPASIFAVLGMLGFAGRDLATRAAPATLGNAQLGVLGFAVLVVAGAGTLAISGGAIWPDPVRWAMLVAGVVAGVLAYGALTGAMRTGEIGHVAPYRYTRLVFAMILGMAVFGERPDAMTLLGSAVIVLSGLFSMLRARRAG